MKCPYCGRENESHYKFCVGCGEDLKSVAAPEPAKASPRVFSFGQGQSRIRHPFTGVRRGTDGTTPGVMPPKPVRPAVTPKAEPASKEPEVVPPPKPIPAKPSKPVPSVKPASIAPQPISEEPTVPEEPQISKELHFSEEPQLSEEPRFSEEPQLSEEPLLVSEPSPISMPPRALILEQSSSISEAPQPISEEPQPVREWTKAPTTAPVELSALPDEDDSYSQDFQPNSSVEREAPEGAYTLQTSALSAAPEPIAPPKPISVPPVAPPPMSKPVSAPEEPVAPVPRICANCGAQVPEGFAFCGVCGTRFAPPKPKVPSLTLIHSDGSEGEHLTLPEGETLIGRDVGIDTFSEDPFLSPKHAIFTYDAAAHELIVTDLDSLNGLFLRLRPRTEVEIYDGDLFRIGQQLLRFESLEHARMPRDVGDAISMGSPLPSGAWGRLATVIALDEESTATILAKPEIHCGREKGDICFPDDGFVSGSHCRLYERQGRLYLQDLGSTNGTYIRIRKERKLVEGDLLLIGQQLFGIRLPD